MVATTYSVRVEGALDGGLSRWLWLVKWFLALPHYLVLSVLWVVFAVFSVYAFFAILFTGRYPRAVFDFNVGVLRWTWRVHYYAFGALATDRYPPFTLGEAPDYPARLDIAYPAHLSRGLVLVKWWLLAIPHYLIVGIFLGGGTWLARQASDHPLGWVPDGLIGLLALIAAVMLAFTGRYPQNIFDLVLGLNRWVLRVAAYAGLMTDDYPPFRLDIGGHEPTGTLTVGDRPVATAPVETPPSAAPRGRPGWTARRIVAAVSGSLLVLVSLGLLAGGGTALWLHNSRDGGYVTSGTDSHHSAGYAITSDRITVDRAFVDLGWQRDLLGKVRIRVTSDAPGTASFVGIAPTVAVNRYLSGVPHSVVSDLAGRHESTIPGRAAPQRPATAGIWVVQAAGTGRQVLTWTPRSGDWTVVVMNRDASAGVSITGDVGATVPALGWIAAGLLIGGGVVLLFGALLVVTAIRHAGTPSSGA